MGIYTFLGVVFILTSGLTTCYGQGCNNGDWFGVENTPNENKAVDTFTTTTTFIIEDHTSDRWQIDCCGPIQNFIINSRRMDNPNTDWIKMLIWRPVSGTTSPYTLVYSETFLNVQSLSSHTMPVTQSFTVKPNDLIGYTSPTYILDYDNRAGQNPNVYFAGIDPAVSYVANTGDTTTWTNKAPSTYGIRMNVNANNDPTFTNGGATAQVDNSDPSGQAVLTVTVADADTAVSELTVTMANNGQFTYDATTGIISTGTITAEHTAMETLTFTATDECGDSTIGTYTITINNDDPVITNVPTYVNITEGATAAQYLFTVDCTDTVTTSLTYTYSGTDPFEIRGNQVWYDGTTPLVYNTQPQYALPITCSDGEKTDIETLYVDVLPNMPPVITNLQDSTNVSITTNMGTIIFQVLVTNPESTDILDFSIVSVSTSNPDCPNYVAILDNGFVSTTQLLVNVTYVSCEYDVTVSDGFNSDTSRLTVAFTNFDATMSCQNMPTNITVQENTAIGTSIFNTIIKDNDNPPQAKTFTLNAVQPVATSYFEVSKTNDTQAVISTASNVLDYEALASTTLTLVVHVVDSRMSLFCSLDVYVQNVCEAPAFDSSTYTVIADEGLNGQSLGIPAMAVTDPDNGETFTYLMDCGTLNGRIAMDPTTRELTYSADYDVDNGVDPTSISCTVTVRDSCGLNDTATLTITIQHIDDNTPQFAQSIYSFLHYCPSVGVGAVVGTVSATDADDAPHDTMTLALAASADVSSFHIDATSGDITVVRALNCSTDYNLVVTVTDQDGDSVQVDVQIRVAATTPAPTTTVVYEYRRFWEDPLNYLWFIPAVIILAITLAVLCWTALTCHGKQGCTAVLARLRAGRKINLHRPGKKFQPFEHNVKSVRNHPPKLNSWK